MNTVIGKYYKCLKDYKCGNCSYVKNKIYYCNRNGYLKDDNNISWSCTDDWFAEYLEISTED